MPTVYAMPYPQNEFNGRFWIQMKDQPIFAYMLATLFIGLKLTGHIDWGWIWILAPLWVGIAWAMARGFVSGFIISYRAKKNMHGRI